jgi:tetratricopeptide (TPR) repeat protein
MVGLAHWERGRPDLAIATMEESIRLGEAAGFFVPQVSTRGELALVHAELDHAETALELVRLAQKRGGKIGLITDITIAGMVALVQIRAGNIQEAESSLSGYEERLSGKPESSFYIPGIKATAEIALHQGQAGKALNLVGHLLAFVSEKGIGLYHLQALVHQAMVLQELDRPAEALASLEEAQALGEAMGSQWMMWQIEAQLGRLAGDSAEAQAHFRQARALIHSIHNHTPDHLRESFLGRADIQALLGTGDHSQ